MSDPNNILITGGAGFIGSNLVEFLLEVNDNYHITVLDKMTYAANRQWADEVRSNSRIQWVEGDICDRRLVNDLFKSGGYHQVYHLAAESHVDNSIENPEVFVKTNVNGTFTLLQAAYKLWMNRPDEVKENFKNARFLHVSTDEVFGSLRDEGYFTEKTPYDPSSPYSASKAGSDHMVRSYHRTYGLNTVITNCSNNYGPRQNDEKLIPVIIRKALSNESIPIYGDGNNVRDWLYVKDHCEALHSVMGDGNTGDTYAIGGGNELKNLTIAENICNILQEIKPSGNHYKKLISFVKDRPGHDFRYAIDASKIKDKLGWQPRETFESGIRKTVEWYMKKYCL